MPSQAMKDRAEAAARELGRDGELNVHAVARAIASFGEAIERETVEVCAKLISEGFDRPVGVPFRNDGISSKNDKCPHGRFMYEDCEGCCIAAIRTLTTEGADSQ